MEALGRMDRRQTGRCNPKGTVDGPGLAQPRAVFSLRCSEILHWGCGVVPLLTHLALDQIGKDFGQDPCQAVYKILDGRGSGSEKKKKGHEAVRWSEVGLQGPWVELLCSPSFGTPDLASP